MNQSPIYTVIKNNSNVDRTIRWTGDGPVWIGAGSTVELPYEAWSKADRNKRVSMIADIQSGATSISLKVMQADGTYLSVPYAVSAIMGNSVKTVANVSVKSTAADTAEDDAKHNIKVKSGDAAAAAEHYGATKAVEDSEKGAHAEGASLNGFQVDSDTQVKGTKQALEEAAKQEAEQKVESEEADQEAANQEAAEQETTEQTGTEAGDDAADEDKEEDSDADSESESDSKADGDAELPEAAAKELFTKYVAEKQWDSARNVMITWAGADKVTFSVKTIQSMKDWDAVVAKYNLR